jgi:hypothetical protein
LWFYSEKEAEKIPMGFDSKEGFTEVDEDCDMANGIWLEMMELKPIEIKKAMEKRARGEGQASFGKMIKCDDFVYIFHGKGSRKDGRQLTRFLSWSNPLETSLLRSLREHLLCVHSPDGGCASFFFPSFSDFLGAISRSARHELLGGCGERGREIWVDWGSPRGRRWSAALFGGFWKFLADCRLEAQFLLGIIVRLNN